MRENMFFEDQGGCFEDEGCLFFLSRTMNNFSLDLRDLNNEEILPFLHYRLEERISTLFVYFCLTPSPATCPHLIILCSLEILTFRPVCHLENRFEDRVCRDQEREIVHWMV